MPARFPTQQLYWEVHETLPWDLVTGVLNAVTILVTPVKVLITVLVKSNELPSTHPTHPQSLNQNPAYPEP